MTQNHLPRGDVDHRDLGPPTPIISQGNVPIDLPAGNPIEAFSPLRFFANNSSLCQVDQQLTRTGLEEEKNQVDFSIYDVSGNSIFKNYINI